MIEWTSEGRVGVMRLAHGKASALDLEFLEAIQKELKAGADQHDAVVVTGAGRIFSAGVDLFRLTSAGGDYVDRFLDALDATFEALIRFEKPLVAAINGHAIAGGCLLAMTCDRRFMIATGARVGVPELRVGVPFPSLAREIFESSLAPHVSQHLELTGANVEGPIALRMGLVDELCEPDVLLSRAIDAAADLLNIRPITFAFAKRSRAAALLRRAADRDRDDRTIIRQIWSSKESHEHIRAYLEATVGRKG
jgi:enoyl-CoA hydratase